MPEWILVDDGPLVVMRHPQGWLQHQAKLLGALSLGCGALFVVSHWWILPVLSLILIAVLIGLARQRGQVFVFDTQKRLMIIDGEGTWPFSELRLASRIVELGPESGAQYVLSLSMGNKMLWESPDDRSVDWFASVLSDRLGIPVIRPTIGQAEADGTVGGRRSRESVSPTARSVFEHSSTNDPPNWRDISQSW